MERRISLNCAVKELALGLTRGEDMEDLARKVISKPALESLGSRFEKEIFSAARK